jgi:hypothetical protein
MKRFVQSFPFLMVFGVCMHVACGDADNGTDTTGVGPVGAQGTGYHPACNLDRRDGYCNILGQNPETCECFDCAQAAKCRGKCIDDGTCDYDPDNQKEDCTCGDCNPGPNCAAPDPDTSTTDSVQSSTADTVATTDAATTAATTDAATTAATTGGMGGAGGN